MPWVLNREKLEEQMSEGYAGDYMLMNGATTDHIHISPGTGSIKIDADAVARAIKSIVDNDEVVEGYSWIQLGLRACDYKFDSVEEAVRHAQEHASRIAPVTVYQEGESDTEMTVWRESLTYEWNVNMKLVFQPNPRERRDIDKAISNIACSKCGVAGKLRAQEVADEFYCCLCGKTASAEKLLGMTSIGPWSSRI